MTIHINAIMGIDNKSLVKEDTKVVEETNEDKADFVIYNTCTVRENANLRVYGRLGYLGSIKKKKPHMMIALCGCMMQEQTVINKIKDSYRFVDLIFGTHNIFKFAELLNAIFVQKRMVIDIWKDTDQIVEDLPIERKYPFKSGVNIMFGCNNFCSYCIIYILCVNTGCSHIGMHRALVKIIGTRRITLHIAIIAYLF